MKKNFVVITIILLTLFVTMACGDWLGILDKSGTEEPYSNPYEQPYYQTQFAQETKDASGSVSEWQPVIPQSTATIQPTATQEYVPHTYSVETTNIGTCICPVRAGEVEVTLVFKGDNLEMPNTIGNPSIFQNVGENRYEFRYITEKSTGPEELMKVITIFDWGYKEEFYTDNSSKLCCVYDYLRLD